MPHFHLTFISCLRLTGCAKRRAPRRVCVWIQWGSFTCYFLFVRITAFARITEKTLQVFSFTSCFSFSLLSGGFSCLSISGELIIRLLYNEDSIFTRVSHKAFDNVTNGMCFSSTDVERAGVTRSCCLDFSKGPHRAERSKQRLGKKSRCESCSNTRISPHWINVYRASTTGFAHSETKTQT